MFEDRKMQSLVRYGQNPKTFFKNSAKRNKESNTLKMSFEDYKKRVEANLTQRVGKKEADRLMALYESGFPKLLEMNLDVVATATALIMGY